MGTTLKLTLSFILFSFQLVCFSQKHSNHKTFETSSNVIYDICFTNNGQAIAIADDKTIKIYNITTDKLIREFKDGHTKQILSIDISKDRKFLVSGGKDSTVIIWDFIQGKKLRSIKSNGKITSVCISPDGLYLAYGGSENIVYTYDMIKSKLIYKLAEHSDDITSVAFSPDGRYLASSSGDKSISIYENGILKSTLKGHKNWVRSISFDSNSAKLISCGDDGKTISWNISDINKTKIISVSKHGSKWLLSTDFNQDNKTYAFADFDGNAVIIAQIGGYKTNVKAPINKIIFKPNEGSNLQVAVATRGKGVLLIEVKNMKFRE